MDLLCNSALIESRIVLMSDCSTNVPCCAGKFVRLDEHARGPAGTAGPDPDG